MMQSGRNMPARFILANLFVLAILIFAAPAVAQRSGPAVERRINTLIARMTLAEKLGQLQQLDGDYRGFARPEHFEMARKGLLGSTLNVRGVKFTNELQRAALESRLKIPMLFGFDVIHGYRTIFPVPLGETASWDADLVEKNAAIAAAESRAAGVHWTFAPMVDIARDARWGRIIEGSGEDPYLGSVMAAARVRGFQGPDYSAPDRVMATAKHWVAYGAAEAGRDYNTTDLSERALREIYFPPFKAAIDAGVGSFMTSFNDLNGVPATANPFVLRDVLRREWKFDGLVVSDYTAVMELMFHGLAANEAEAAMYSLNAGTDMEMVSRFYNKHGQALVRDKKVSMAVIDESVRNVLRTKFRLGLFEKPYADEALERREVFKPAYRDAAKLAAIKSFVLLKNDRQTLPIGRNVDEIALVGPFGDERKSLNGSWAGDGKTEDAVTLLEGLRQKLGNRVRIRHAAGCDMKCETDAGFKAAVDAARDSDFTIVVVGEDSDLSGEAASRSSLDLPGRQLDLVKAIHATGKPYAVVLMNGRPLTINWIAENSPAILETWYGGTMAGPAIADTLFGDANPGGKLPITFPRSVGQIPLYYNHRRTGRPVKESEKYTSKYLDVPNTPLYPFGHGLSYTQFRLSNIRVDKPQILRNGSIKVSVDLENAGKLVGDEVVQIYISDVAATVTRPVKELKAFRRVTLRPAEKRTIEFTLGPKDLQFLDRNLKPVVEPGEFIVYAGSSSENTVQTMFEVVTVLSARPAPSAFNETPDPPPPAPVPAAAVSPEDDAFLEDLSRRTFQFFWDHSSPKTGLTLDRSRTTGEPPASGENHHKVASIAATGFALSGYCIAADRGWVPKDSARERARATLDFFANRQQHRNGWFFHFVDQDTGERRWRSELSSIDTALLLGGVLTVKNCFADDAEIVRLADAIYRRVDFQWMLNGDPYLLSHGWRPESGWIPNRWHDYSEQMILYLLAIGSPTYPIPAQAWYAWDRTWQEYGGQRYLAAVSPLFIHQFSHAWVDFRNRRERRPPYVDYYENSLKATRAQRQFFIDVLSKEFPRYGPNMWGLTASDYKGGYVAWGAPPRHEAIDGSVVPAAPAGSLMFTPDITLAALKEMRSRYGDRVYGKYGFADAFNPHDGWVNRDVLGIDLGITLLSAENLRSGKVWHWFMQNPEVRVALRRANLF